MGLAEGSGPRPVRSSRTNSRKVPEQNLCDMSHFLQEIACTQTFMELLELYDSYSQYAERRQACWDVLMKRAQSPREMVMLCFRARGGETDKLLSLLKMVAGEEYEWYAAALQIEPYATYRDTTRVPVADVVLGKLPIERWRNLYESETDPTNKIQIGQFTGFAPLKLCTHRND